MRVLKIAPTPFFADRGCHSRILGEANSLLSLGNEVRICTYHNGRDIDGLDIKRIPNVPWYNKLEAGPSYHMFYLDALLLTQTLQNTLKWKPDILHAHLHEGAFIGNFCKKFGKIPNVIDLQGSLVGEITAHGFMKDNNPLCKVLKRIENSINNSADAIIVSSGNMADNLKKNYNINSKSVFIVPDGVDTNFFNPFYDTEGLSSKLGIEKDKKIIVKVFFLTLS